MAMSPEASLSGIPGYDAQSRALSLVKAGLSHMTDTFVEMAMGFPEKGTLGFMLDWERTRVPAEALQALDILPPLFVKFSHEEAVMRSGLKLLYYMAGSLSVRESMKYDILYHIQGLMNVFKDNETWSCWPSTLLRVPFDSTTTYAFTKTLKC
jgi:hypothetical protein